MLTALAHGVVLAFGLILALGPQNVFLFSQGAIQPRLVRTLPVVLCAALADTALILLAVGGVSAAALAVSWVETALIVFGVAFLLYIGWVTWHDGLEAGTDAADAEAWTPGRQVRFTLSVSILNPHAILDTVGVIGTSSLVYSGVERAVFAAACVAVSWAFFFALVLCGRFFGKLGVVQRWINKTSAVVIWGAAVYLASGLLEGRG